MEWTFYYEWKTDEKPEWGEWKHRWAYSDFSLKIFVSQLPDIILDRNNPRIEWIVSDVAQHDSGYWFKIPSLYHVPKCGNRFHQLTDLKNKKIILPVIENNDWTYYIEQRSTMGIERRIDIDEFSLENRMDQTMWNKYIKDEWDALMAMDERTVHDQRRLFFISMMMGEWKVMTQLIERCEWTKHIGEYHKANLLLHQRTHMTPLEREELFAKDLWPIANYVEAWHQLLLLHLKYPDWDKSRLYVSVWERIEGIVKEEKMVPSHTWIKRDLNKSWVIYYLQLLRDYAPSEKIISFLVRNMLDHHDANVRRTALHDLLSRIPNIILDKDCIKNGEVQFSRNNGDFVASSSSLIVFDSRRYLVNVRRVNYRIMPTGSYISIVDGQITADYNGITKNEYYFMDRETLEPVSSCRPLSEDIPGRRPERAIVGVEDVRLYRGEDDEIYFYGVTKEFSYTDAIRIIHGRYDIDRGRLTGTTVFRPPYEENSCEKNWVHCGRDRYIYRWHPIEIGKIDKNGRLVIDERIPSPPYFQEFRGSSAGVEWRGLTWFTVHSVHMVCGRRKYIHHLVIINQEKKQVVGVSTPFCFEGHNIEYSIGLDIHKDRMLFLYSVNDAVSRYVAIPIHRIVDWIVFIAPSSEFYSSIYT